MVMPNLSRYSCYRRYLEDYYTYKKTSRSGFSYRLFAKKAGLSSPNYLQLVIQGKRNLSPYAAVRVAKAMGLSQNENALFVSLVRFDLAQTDEEKREAERLKLRAIKALISKEIPRAQARVLAEWYHLIVRELVLMPGFQADGAWISDRLRGLITAKQAEESLKLLVAAGFVEAKGKKYRVKEPVIDTGDSFGEALIISNHIETLDAWKKIIPQTTKPERELGILNIPIPADKIPELKKKITAFQDEIIGWLQDAKDPDQIVQLGTYLIPVTKDRG